MANTCNRLYLTAGHATTARNITLSQSGVTFIKNGSAGSVGSLLIANVGIGKRAFFELNWATTTMCFVDVLVLEA